MGIFYIVVVIGNIFSIDLIYNNYSVLLLLDN